MQNISGTVTEQPSGLDISVVCDEVDSAATENLDASQNAAVYQCSEKLLDTDNTVPQEDEAGEKEV